jgi:hypothetical protein
MENIQADEVSWHNDGHILVLQLSASTLRILETVCPHEDNETAACRHTDAKCAVEWFITRFGLECNVGVCAPEERLEVAWVFTGDWHRELEQGQVWVMPVNDEAFAAWIVTQQ